MRRRVRWRCPGCSRSRASWPWSRSTSWRSASARSTRSRTGTGSRHATWIGLQNFREIFGDRTARGALWHTLELAGCFVVSVNAIGLTLALGLNRAVKTRHLLRTLFFAPVVLSPLAIALSGSGSSLLRRAEPLLGSVGLESWQHAGSAIRRPRSGRSSSSWSGSSPGSRWCSTWPACRASPDEVYEATLVDGASGLVSPAQDRPAAARARGDRQRHDHADHRPARLRPGDGADRGRARRRDGDAWDAGLQADVLPGSVRLRRRVRAHPDGADHGRSR